MRSSTIYNLLYELINHQALTIHAKYFKTLFIKHQTTIEKLLGCDSCKTIREFFKYSLNDEKNIVPQMFNSETTQN